MTTSATKEEILKMMEDQICFFFKYEKVGFSYGKPVKGKEREKIPHEKTISIYFRVKHPNIEKEFVLLDLRIKEGDEDINKKIESFINSIWLLSEFREHLKKSYILMWMHDPVSEFKLTVDWK
jgi:hypothetical protein